MLVLGKEEGLVYEALVDGRQVLGRCVILVLRESGMRAWSSMSSQPLTIPAP